jgi:hypothetical protein
MSFEVQLTLILFDEPTHEFNIHLIKLIDDPLVAHWSVKKDPDVQSDTAAPN